jgi:hypothetical protein
MPANREIASSAEPAAQASLGAGPAPGMTIAASIG